MFVVVCSRFIVRQVFTFPACSHLCVYRLRHFSCRTGELVMIPVGFTDTITTSIMFCSVSAVLSEQDSAAAQQYSRQGCPTGLRADVWALILNATNQPQVPQPHMACYVSWVGDSCECLERSRCGPHSCSDSQILPAAHSFGVLSHSFSVLFIFTILVFCDGPKR